MACVIYCCEESQSGFVIPILALGFAVNGLWDGKVRTCGPRLIVFHPRRRSDYAATLFHTTPSDGHTHHVIAPSYSRPVLHRFPKLGADAGCVRTTRTGRRGRTNVRGGGLSDHKPSSRPPSQTLSTAYVEWRLVTPLSSLGPSTSPPPL